MYAVLGVTGRTGRVTAEALHAVGEPLRVVVRKEADGEHWRQQRADVAIADLDDEASLERAFEGASGVYFLVPHDFSSDDLVKTAFGRAHRAARAARSAGVRHVVCLSSIGAQHEQGTGVVRAVHAAERAIAEVGIPATCLRAAYFQENWEASARVGVEHKILPSFLPADLRIPMVATRDIGAKAAAALRDPSSGKKPRIISLAGPLDYTPVDVAHALAEILGHKVTLQETPLDEVATTMQNMGASPYFAEQYREFIAAARSGKIAWEEGAKVTRGVVPIGSTLNTILRA